MNRDVKLGLALGILVIGFAAAFCFPRRTPDELASAPVAGPRLAIVDQEIRQLRVRSFIEEELRPAPEPTPAAPRDGVEIVVAEPDLAADLPDAFLASAPEPIPAVDAAPPAQPRIEPAPTAPSTPVEAPRRLEPREPVAVPGVVTVGPDDLKAPPPVVESAVDVLTPDEERRYTVQSGDTLSGIAGKLLGSRGKYLALYEANREVMSSPDALKPGMVLRIPDVTQSFAETPPGRRSGEPVKVAATEADDRVPQRKRAGEDQ